MKSQKSIFLVPLTLLAIIFSQFTSPQSALAACTGVVYVASTGSGTNGCSWGTAYTTLQSALADPTLVSGDQIWVAAGTYYPDQGSGQINDDRNSTFTLVNGVSIYGGFAGTETLLTQRNPAVNVTILNGDIGTIGVNTDNAFNVVTALNINTATILDGFTVRDGYADSGSDFGGGMYASSNTSALLIRDVTFSNNFAGNGGGLAAFESNLSLTRVIFSTNTARQYGGGIYNQDGSPILLDVVFDNNQTQQPASPGGGMHSTNSNSAIYTVAPSLTNVTFSNNRALQGGGGGMFNFESHAILTNVTFNGNTAFVRGGAMLNEGSNPILNNVTISGNTAPAGSGGAIRNIFALGVTPSNPIIRNTILWGDGSEEIVNDAGNGVTITNSVIQGGCPALGTCSGLVTTTPSLSGLAPNGGFTQTMAIGIGSSALNVGSNATCAATDQRGFTRPLTGIDPCDAGAYEFGGTGTTTTASSATTTYGNTSVNLTATVAPNPGGGTVQFYIDGTLVGSAAVNAGTGIATLNYDPSTLNAGTYTIRADFSGVGVFLPSTSNPANNGILTVNQRTLNVTATGINKVYDGTVTATVTLNDDRILGDNLTLTYTATFADKNVGTGKTVSVTGITISGGTDAGNYVLGNTTATTTANITARPITVTAVTDTKVYDGTTSSTGLPTITTGSLGTGDTVTWTQTFDTKNVGINKTLTPAGTVNDGNGGNNYTVTFVTNTTGVITARAITVTAVTDTKVYDGTTSSAGVPTITTGSLGTGDTATWTQTFDTKNVGTNKTLTPAGTVNDGNGGNNYTVTFVTNTTGVITARAITVTAVTDTKGYDGNTSSVGVPTITTGSLGTGDTATWTQTFDTKNVGTNKTLTPAGTVNDGNGGNNYTVTFVTNTTGVITARAITVTAVTDTKVYDGTTSSVGVPTLTGTLAPGDTVTWTQTFDTRNVGTNKTLTPAGTVNDGNGGNNYTVNFVTNTTGVITARAITVTAVTDTKIYDGTTSSAGVPTITTGSLGTGDTATWTQTFDTPLVGTNKTLTPAGTVNDGNGGNNYTVTLVAVNTGTITGTPLNVTINQAGGQADPTNTSPISFTVVFTASVNNFVTGDVTLSGTAVGVGTTATVTGAGTTYTITVSGMVGDGTVIASIPAGVASDVAGNISLASTSTDNTVTYDTTAPTVTIEQAIGQVDPTNASPINFTVTFSEAVSNFVTGDVSFTGSTVGGTLVGNVTGGPTTYNVAVTGMTGSGTVVATIAAGVATDAAGNTSAASTSTDNTVTFDAVGPTVTINQAVGQVDPTNASPINFTVTFSEAVANFVTGDVSFTGSTAGGTLVGTVTGGPTTYNVAVTGMTSSGTVVATIAAGAASDALGNLSSASTSTDNVVTYDTVVPTVTINQAVGQVDPTNGSPINFTVTFSEAVVNFATGDISFTGSTVGGALVGTVSGGPTTYNVAVTGMTGTGTVVATIAAGVATDAAGNANTASTSTDNTVTYDGVVPTVTIEQAIGQVDPTNTSPINFTVTFSEAVANFATGDVSFTGSTVGGTLVGTVTGGPLTYNVAVTGMTGSGTVVATIAAGVASDATGNANTASTSLDNTVTYDGVVPTVTINQAIGQVDPTNATPINFTVTFSEAVANFATGDVSFTGSTVGGALVGTVTGGPTTYNVAVTGMTGSGTVVATIAAGVASDATGNANTASTSADNTVSFDGAGPTVTINQAVGQVDPTNASPINFTVTFSEAVLNFTTGDISFTGSTVGGALVGTVTGGPTTYNVAVTGMTGNGTVVATIAAGAASDGLGNTNAASTSTDNTVTFDAVAPTVTIEQAVGQVDPTNASPINFTVTFSEPVLNFVTGDVSFTGSTVGGTLVGTVSGGPTTYNVAVTGMTSSGTVVATIAAGVARDASGNTNAASTSVDNTVTYDTTRPVVTIGAPVPTSTITGPVDFGITITGATTVNLVSANVTVTTTGTAAATTITITNGTTNNPTVTLSGITGSGTITITIAAGIASDGAGNTSLAAGPSTTLLVDNAGPIVLFNAYTVPTDGAILYGGPVQLTVAFNEDVKNDGSAGAANNTANFLLVESGPNLTLDTVSCALGAQPDDVQIPVNTATYSNNGGAGPFVATLAINGGTPLPVGSYHLFVCGTTSVEDLLNNELNNGATDTVIDFVVLQATAIVPKTGFPENTVTNLPVQPEGLAYSSTDMWLEIPRLNVKIPIVGVPKTSAGWDVTWLDNQAGWLDGSAYPTWSGNSVITAHVWDALNNPGPFARIKELRYGDQIKIHAFGQVYTYEIRETTTISPANTSAMLKHQDKTWLTLITCEGFQEKTQDYSSRRMVRAVLVSVTAEK